LLPSIARFRFSLKMQSYTKYCLELYK
jgi:hypothetical protein